ncbi:protein of unknown function (plasmid) [Cupriavidus taiwanensis]|uniref:Uncharacterized protein n=1 Tax=Cupriavidus taiwanensis TaxID=164546 RepID=A0A7Z7JCP4_9BURK|nr:protein of unknown function [Cupriavidus taiwanensis]SOZ11994.1 protein of unknown function [Cupriavidus taiwanensis]SOZ43352.1 protein of unknown function [Cupriavidus taiwanensis]SPC22595.1 protein of unknown function [Cupriavidus taiwanensis]SPD54105.1 protein of unknown function [Cupriavidus taiwanensis]
MLFCAVTDRKPGETAPRRAQRLPCAVNPDVHAAADTINWRPTHWNSRITKLAFGLTEAHALRPDRPPPLPECRRDGEPDPCR